MPTGRSTDLPPSGGGAAGPDPGGRYSPVFPAAAAALALCLLLIPGLGPLQREQALLAAGLCGAYAVWLAADAAVAKAGPSRREPLSRGLAWAMAALFTAAYALLWPTDVILDDGAIVLRYMDNAARGFLYHYNPADGPVFGVSGFLHGLLAGLVAWSGLLPPLESLFAVNLGGLLLLGAGSFGVLGRFTQNRGLLFPAWAVLVLSSEFLIVTAKQGLETPLHLAILVAAALFLLRDEPRRFWVACALAVVSKLDAVPVVGVFVAVRMLGARGRMREEASAGVRWGLAPLVAWGLIATAVFGSPIPQSAAAKWAFHRSSSPFPLPFLEGFATGKAWILVLGTAACLAAALVLVRRLVSAGRREDVASRLMFLGAAAAYVAFFLVVNPQERMGWYYVVPSFFLTLQVLVAFLDPHCGWLERRAPAAATAALLLFAALWWPRVSHTVHRIVESLEVVEGERIAVGAWIRRHAAPGDTLVAGHGHIAREAGLYTVDFTGLNSRLVTDLGCDLGRVLDRVRPRWVAHDGLLDSAVAARNGLFLVRSFFNLAERGGPAWRVYRRGDGAAPGAVRPLRAADVDAEGAVEDRGATIRLRTRQAEFRIHGDAGALSVGLCRQSTRLALRARAESADDSVRVLERPLVARDTLRPAEGLTEEWVIPLAGRPPYRVSVVAADPAGAVTPSLLLLDPVVIGRVR